MSSAAPRPGRTLVVVRHAKAEAAASSDRDRVLAERGRRDAAAAGAWLAERGFVPTHALVSAAARTRETWELLADASGSQADPTFDDGLYSAGPDAAREIIAAAEPDAEVLAVVGHNPTMGYLAASLADADPDMDAFRGLAGGFPTCAIAVYEVPVPWSGLSEGSARLVAFWSP